MGPDGIHSKESKMQKTWDTISGTLDEVRTSIEDEYGQVMIHLEFAANIITAIEEHWDIEYVYLRCEHSININVFFGKREYVGDARTILIAFKDDHIELCNYVQNSKLKGAEKWSCNVVLDDRYVENVMDALQSYEFCLQFLKCMAMSMVAP
jgi:hypothetical protein